MNGIKLRRPGTNPTLETRSESYECIDKRKRYSEIIEIMKYFDRPMTAKEIAVEMYRRGYTPTAERNFTAPRLTEMSEKGIVEPIGKKVCSYTGRKVAVYGLIKKDHHSFYVTERFANMAREQEMSMMPH